MKKKPSRKAKQALTKEQLVKLYEEFKKKKEEEFEGRVSEYKKTMMYKLRNRLSDDYGRIPNWIKGEDFSKAFDVINEGYPKYTKPTFDEFMESMEEKRLLTTVVRNLRYTYDPVTGMQIWR